MYQNMTRFIMMHEIKLKQSLLSLASFQNNKKTDISFVTFEYFKIIAL